MAQSVEKWRPAEVQAWLKENDMAALVESFEEHEVTGLDLMLLTEDDLRSMLKISKLQAAKVKSLLDKDATNPPAEQDAAAATNYADAVPPVAQGEGWVAFTDDAEGAELERNDLARATSTTVAPSSSARTVAPAVTVTATLTPVAGVTAGVAALAPPSAPPAAGQPVGTFLPSGTGALQLDAYAVERYQTSVRTITTLEAEGVAQALPAARSKLQAVQKRLALQKDAFEKLKAEETERSEKVSELEDGKWYPGKYILGSKKREEKLNRNKEKLDSVSNKLRAVGAQLEELHASADAGRREIDELTAKCVALDEARGYCANLLQSAFAGGAVGDSAENALETEVAGLGPKIEEVRRFKTVYSQAYELMHGATEALEQAMQLLSSASRLCTVDIMGNFIRPGPRRGMGGVMVDVMIRRQMQQGAQLLVQGGKLALKANALVPDMPRVKTDKLKELSAGFGLLTLVFDNMITDLIVAAKVRDMLGKGQAVKEDVKYAESWIKGWLNNRINQDLRSLEATLGARRQELHAHRMRLLEAWIAARAAGAVAEAPRAPPPAQGVPVYGHGHGYVV